MNTFLYIGRRFGWSVILAATLWLMPAQMAVNGQPLMAGAEERETDIRQMRQIYEALEAYRKEHDRWPDYLSDLVPKFLPNPAVLVSPVERRTGQSRVFGYGDPKLQSSYVFEFSAHPAGGAVNQGRAVPLTMGEWKTMQMEEFGPATPLLRCHLHDPVLNIAVSGDFYETGTFWESDSVTHALVKRLGSGPGARNQQTVAVRVLDAATGAPLSGVEVTVSDRRTELGPLPPRTVTTDTAGECLVPLGGGTPESAALAFRRDGYANAPVHWPSRDSIPESYTAKLQPAVAVGGLVRDPEKSPISGAKIVIGGVVRDEVGQFIIVEYDTVETDAQGRWTSQGVPGDFAFLNLKLSHPEHLPAEFDEVESDEPERGEVSRKALLAGAAVLEMRPGIRIEGTVAGLEHEPVAGAEVTLWSSAEPPVRLAQQTDDHGRFRFVIMETGDFHLVVQAPGFSPLYRLLEISVQPDAYELALGKGEPLRGRVLDGEGKPVPGASVSLGRHGEAERFDPRSVPDAESSAPWHSLPLLTWSATTDSEGRFVWENAPAGLIMLTASRPGMISASQPATAGAAEEVVFRLVKSFLLTGQVIDAETGEPIDAFRIVQGHAWPPNPVNWEFRSEQPGQNGTYSVTVDQRRGGGQLQFMVRADGYLPAASPGFAETGWHTHDFELKKGGGPQGIARLPDGAPAEGADVVLLGAGYISLGKGVLTRLEQAGTFAAKTDAEGRFSLPAALPSPTIVAVHSQGYAEMTADDLARDGVMILKKWGHIQGVLKDGTRPAAGQMVMVSPSQAGGRGLNYDFESFRTTTDGEGRFEFTHVPPGTRQLVQLIQTGARSWRHSHQQPVEVKAGEVTELVYGGVGRPVIGRLKLSDPDREVDWNVGYHMFGTRMPRPSQPFRSQEEAAAWNNSPEVKLARENHRSYGVRFEEDGSFRILNVSPGTYDFRINLHEPGEQDFRPGPPIGSITREVVVPEPPGGVTDEPLDLGELLIEARPADRP